MNSTGERSRLSEEVIFQVNKTSAASAARRLTAAGGEVWIVGGTVRDVALGTIPKDVDLMVRLLTARQIGDCLDSLPGKSKLTGQAFTVHRWYPQLGAPVEVAMPRKEVSTGVGHRDFEVFADPTVSVEDDMSRRDFTVNAMAVRWSDGLLYDHRGGLRDCREASLRVLSSESFVDDPLRIMRGLVMISRHGLLPDAETFSWMTRYSSRLEHLPGERRRDEVDKLFSSGWPVLGLRYALLVGAMPHIAPELNTGSGSNWAWLEHAALMGLDRDARLAAFMLDLDPDTVRRILTDLRLTKLRVDRITSLVRLSKWSYLTSERMARKFMGRAQDLADTLIDLRMCQIGGRMALPDALKRVVDSQVLVQRIRERGDAYLVEHLAVNGDDLIELGFTPGPEIGEMLKKLLDHCVISPQLNTRPCLLGIARDTLESQS